MSIRHLLDKLRAAWARVRAIDWRSLSWRDLVPYFPLVTTFLLEAANIGQIHRMWTEHTAAGQSILSWMSVNAALWLWWIYYRTLLKEQRIAQWATMFGICMNTGVILTIVYWRYLV